MVQANAQPVSVAIIGTGFGGLAQAVYLQKAGITSFAIYEKGDEVGGTWRENTYPGAACDVPSHLYSYEFEPHYPWAYRYGKQAEILGYLKHVAGKYGLRRHIRFGKQLTEAHFDEARGVWKLNFADGSKAEANVLVSSVGQLHQPQIPKIKGAETFAGTAFHSARWRHDLDFTGKRVAVIGTGPSSVQFVPAIQPTVGHMDVYQRSPGWTVPKVDRKFNKFERWLLDTVPALHTLDRKRIFWWFEFLGSALQRQSRFNKPATAIFRNAAKFLMNWQVKDPAMRARLTPDYAIGCKRVLLSNEWLPALTASNVDLVTDGIREITPDGIIANDGTLRAVDTIIYGTGFEATGFLAPMTITGRAGQTLNQRWQDGAEAYMGMTVSGFPNLYILYGPNTNLGAGSIIYMLEAQAKYVTQAVQALQAKSLRWLDVKAGVISAYNLMLRRRSKEDSVYETGCHSWYITADGKNTVSWVGYMNEYAKQVARLKLDDFETAPIAVSSVAERVPEEA
ncbi:NAD(P)/FAD-dependent oxidoreductase [Nevskia sp.]|uniref:flavin-containing monooxygenase n=1 Tax=Nevskia sp. TaxID=1929292 RepID=UPI0025D0FFDB|nr:NAD(P)/FAD-dependent oxidoreductase [Nevskia sp.]